jgi:hypothetical protein
VISGFLSVSAVPSSGSAAGHREFNARLSARQTSQVLETCEVFIIAGAVRKLLHLIYGVLKNQLLFDPNYGKQFAFYP